MLAEGLRAPVKGAAAHGGAIYLSEGGFPARISRLDRDGSLSTVLEVFLGLGTTT